MLFSGCPAGQEYKGCGSACPRTCDQTPKICTSQCVQGCFCSEGTVLHNNICIPPYECPTCPPDQVYRDCGSACPPTCDQTPRICTAQCVAGCFCREGTVLHHDKCIPPSQCPSVQQCPTGQVYKECGSACPTTCDQTPRGCTLQCVAGCFCSDGLVLHDGKCIPLRQCPPVQQCPAGQVYKECGSACPPTCDQTPRVCTDQCIQGCFCSDGLVLHDGKCIPLRQCPPVQQCPAGQVYKECGSACPPTCDQTPRGCTLQCVAGCFCSDGLVLHDGKCIPTSQCPPVQHCSAGQVYKKCGSACPPSCDQTPRGCTLQCVAGCFCSDGLVLHDGKCIPLSQCPPVQQCPAGQVYKECGSACPPTCDQTPRGCTLQCVAGCFCSDGLVLHDGKCIPPSQCPPVQHCSAGQVYKKCGSACPPTCDQTPQACDDQCAQGCFCTEGTVLHDGRCIPLTECPVCPAGQVFMECGSPCPRTCDKRIQRCMQQCGPGCFCPEGTVLH